MARPLSETKRLAVLAAAARQVAALGVGAPTARIARDAGVAEGTLFTYFSSKDELLNQLYLALKHDLARATLAAYPGDGSPRQRFEHLWNVFIDWALADPERRKALRQLAVSDRITAETRQQGAAAFGVISDLLAQSRSEAVLKDHPEVFVGAVLEALTDATLELIAREPDKRDHYKKTGFGVLWNGIAN